MKDQTTFVDRLLGTLAKHPSRPVIGEMHGATHKPFTGAMMAAMVGKARAAIRSRGVKPGDRVVLLAPNSARWVAADLAMLAEGAVVVPLYARQAAGELVTIMKHAEPALVVVDGEALAEGPRAAWPEMPLALLDDLFAGDGAVDEPPVKRAPADPVTIIYTSGTSGEAKGVVTTAANVGFMLPVIDDAVGRLMGDGGHAAGGVHRVFHYLPFCFAGSRMVLWTALWRGSELSMSTSLDNLKEELAAAKPNYVLNVPALLDRIRSGVDGQIVKRGKLFAALWAAAVRGNLRGKGATLGEKLALAVAKRLIAPKVKAQIGADLKTLISGSAPLSEETQRWFSLIGIPVYEVYGLTETTAIVTMDEPGDARPGYVGRPIRGVEIRVAGDDDELQTRGAHIFAGYWKNEAATKAAFTDDGWFRTGDQATLDETRRVKVIGRTKNVLVPSSGHNVPPEPLEQRLLELSPGAVQAVVVGHGRPFLTAIVAGPVAREVVEAAVATLNADIPHYRRIRAFHLDPAPMTPESGLLTANQKLKRRAIEAHYEKQIAEMYA
ncbi:MAG: AMP-binding protein [Deltaproteobacteria bacterium]|nr:AMP-binding protein [Deltaproteobacteria bacterium]